MTLDYLKNKVPELPKSPGIYIFKGSTLRPSTSAVSSVPNGSGQAKEYLYIGKALNLRNRLKSYLKTQDARIQKMISSAESLEYIGTDSDIEALILESQMIKKLRPQFNIVMRDDKQYGFVGFTNDKYPKIFITHQPHSKYRNIEISNFIGPFTDMGALKTTLRLLRKIFPYCTCTQLHNNYCLNYHIGKCLGECCLKLKVKSGKLKVYRKNIKAVGGILLGKKSSLIKNFEKEMASLGKRGKFEEARELQWKIAKLKRVFENARIIHATSYMLHATETNKDKTDSLKQLTRILSLNRLPRRIEAYDIANIQGQYAVGAMIVFISGKPDKNEYRKFKIYTKNTTDDTAMLKEVLTRRFKHSEWPYPDLILVDGGKGQLNAAQDATPKEIPIIALTKDDQHRGTKLYLKNKKEAVPLSKLPSSVKNLLLNLDAEAHRFAISYYRHLHKKSLR